MFSLRDKRKLSNGQLLEIWKETALTELCSFFIDIVAFEIDKLCLGWGFCLVFSTQGGGEVCTEKLSRGGDFDGQN